MVKQRQNQMYVRIASDIYAMTIERTTKALQGDDMSKEWTARSAEFHAFAFGGTPSQAFSKLETVMRARASSDVEDKRW